MSNRAAKDSIYATPLADVGGFVFDQKVADVFPDMLKRSVPGYQSVIAQSGLLAEKFAVENTTCYDLGCSLGATLMAMRHGIAARPCRLIGVDNSEAMIGRCNEIMDEDARHAREDGIDLAEATLVCDDICNIQFDTTSVAALNFTLQFVAPEERQELLARIAAATIEGGVLILSEKIAFPDPVLNELFIDRYHAFKRANGYSDLEISQKRNALENVLIPDSLETHKQRLQYAGFSRCSVWFQCFNFVSLIAIK